MMKRIYGIALIFLLASCNALPSFMQPQIDTPESAGDFAPSELMGGEVFCESTYPTEADIQYALNFGSELFTETLWSQTYEISEYSAYIEYNHRSIPANAYVEMLLFCVDQGTDNVKEWYFDPNIEVIFEALGVLTINSCEKQNQFLYEVDADGEESDYVNRMWVHVLDKVHALTVKFVVEATYETKFEEYSRTLFPDFSACP
jgi:hypothetical protein